MLSCKFIKIVTNIPYEKFSKSSCRIKVLLIETNLPSALYVVLTHND